MIRTLALPALALAAVAWLAGQPAFAHEAPHKKLGALIAVTVPLFVLDVVLTARRRSRARRAQPSSPPPVRSSGSRAGARW